MSQTGIQRSIVGAVAAKATLTVTEYQNGEIMGYLYNAFYHKAVPVQSSLQLLLGLEAMFDALGFPKKFFELRSLSGTPKHKEEGQTVQKELDYAGEKEKATFVIQVRFRRNATWQGELDWVDGKRTQKFRSALELVKMIDEALDKGSTGTLELWQDGGAQQAERECAE